MSAIICSGECGLFGPSKVGGGASDIFEMWLDFACFRVFFKRLFFGENGLWGRKSALNIKCFPDLRCSTMSNDLMFVFLLFYLFLFFLKKKYQASITMSLSLSDNAKVGKATLVGLELLLVREVAVTDVAVRRSPGQARAVDVPARLHVIRKS
jgi:hypothetical protein